MSVTAVVGCQWGDEAKGKIVDILCQEADIVARFNGGDNAGHTVVNPFGTFKLRLTPNGFYNPNTVCLIGPGAVINLATLLEEIQMIQGRGIELVNRMWVSPRCNVIMPYHPQLEAIYENVKGSGRTGTTRRGIGPVYADKVSYNGITLFDLMNETQFTEKLRIQLAIKNPILQAFGLAELDFEALRQEISSQFAQIRPVVREPFGLVQKALKDGKNILLEGAQATFLDNTWGTYPYVTASNTLACGASVGLGIAPSKIDQVVGVAKAYTTRVGAGPLPTELLDKTGEVLRNEGQEFGTVTGRARRCGWFDANLVRFAVQLNGITELALTKLDVLDTLPEIKICSGYRSAREPGRSSEYWEGDAAWLGRVEPEYFTMQGWQRSTREIRRFADLPKQAQLYVRKIEELVETRVGLVSVGPGREEIIPLA